MQGCPVACSIDCYVSLGTGGTQRPLVVKKLYMLVNFNNKERKCLASIEICSCIDRLLIYVVLIAIDIYIYGPVSMYINMGLPQKVVHSITRLTTFLMKVDPVEENIIYQMMHSYR